MAEREQVRTTVRVIRLGARGLYRSQLPRMAAALAYRTIFSIIPVFVISLVVFGSLVSDDQVEYGVTRLLDFSGLNQITLADPALGDDQVGPPRPEQLETSASAEPASSAVPIGRLDQLIGDLVTRVNNSLARVPTASIALISVAVLIYAALSMLVELERSFNSICRAPSGRPWLRRIVLYWTILTLGGVMLAATFSVGDIFLRWTTSMVGGGSKAIASLLGYVVTVGISSLLLVLVYLIVPNTRVRFRPAFGGALVAAILWEMGKWGFRQYLDFSTGYSNLYGSLALLPLFLLWVYATWLIVLFGLQVAYTTQNFDELAEDLEHGDAGPSVVDPACILLVAAGVARRFADGKSSFPNQIAREVGLPDALTARMMRRLVELGVVHEVEQGDARAYALARPADAIDAAEVLRAAADLSARRDRLDEPGLARLVAARERALEGRTLAQFAAERSENAPDSPGSS